jgi:hypothetical protein
MTIWTLYVLLGDDLRLLCFQSDADHTFTILTSTSMILFLVELILASIAKTGYFNSFFFYLDTFSTVSIITDIKPIMDYFTGG